MTEQQMLQLGPANLHGLHDEERERHQNDGRDENGGGRQSDRPVPPGTMVAVQPSGSHSNWASCSSLIASAPVPSSAIEMSFG